MSDHDGASVLIHHSHLCDFATKSNQTVLDGIERNSRSTIAAVRRELDRRLTDSDLREQVADIDAGDRRRRYDCGFGSR